MIFGDDRRHKNLPQEWLLNGMQDDIVEQAGAKSVEHLPYFTEGGVEQIDT
jgi:hypothetical protein